jgi:hypothetical protein
MGARINGNEYDFSSIEVTAVGAGLLTGVTGIDYNDKLDPGLTRGTSSTPRGATRGPWSGAGSLELLRTDFGRWIAALGPGFSEQDVVINVTYFEPLLGVQTDTIYARISENSTTPAAGNEGVKVKCTLFILQPILWNGLPRVLPV